MARVGRYKGALVLEQAGQAWLIGNPKEPCPEVPGALGAPFVLALPAPVAMAPGFVVDDGLGDGLGAGGAEPAGEAPAGAALAKQLAERLVIARNGSVSERLWRLVRGETVGEPRRQWLLDMPAAVWEIVRDTVLRCS